jgi:hypothetical protein
MQAIAYLATHGLLICKSVASRRVPGMELGPGARSLDSRRNRGLADETAGDSGIVAVAPETVSLEGQSDLDSARTMGTAS